MSTFKKGDQVVYFPAHVRVGNLKSPEVEFGIVITPNNEYHWSHVLYWHNGKDGLELESTSKLTSNIRLRKHDIKSQEEINRILQELEQ